MIHYKGGLPIQRYESKWPCICVCVFEKQLWWHNSGV